MRATLVGVLAAALVLSAPANAAKPRTGDWKAELASGEFVQLSVAKKGAKRVVRLEKFQDRAIASGCTVVAVGGFLGERGRALKVDRSGRFRGSFGSFISPLGRRSVVVNSGRFSSPTKGKVRITSNLDGTGQGSFGQGPGCPKTTTFTIRRR